MRKKVLNVFRYVFLSIVSFISVFPFFWMIVAATNKSVEVTKGTMIPGTYFFENLKTLLASDLQYVNAFKNSIIIAIVTTALAMVVSSAAGYAFVVYKTKARERVFNFIFLSMMVPFAAKIIPMFRMFSNLGLLNSFSAIILPAIGTPFLVFFFKQNTHAFPVETIQAARVDGLGEYGIFFRIYMPMMKSTYAAAGIFAFMASWNNYMWPLIALQSNDKFTLPLAVSNLAAGFTPDYGMVMVGIIISTIPTILVFFLLQKAFVEGMVGSVK